MSASFPFGPRRSQQTSSQVLVDLTEDDGRTDQSVLSQHFGRARTQLINQTKPTTDNNVVEISSDSDSETTPKSTSFPQPTRYVRIQSPYHPLQGTPISRGTPDQYTARSPSLRLPAASQASVRRLTAQNYVWDALRRQEQVSGNYEPNTSYRHQFRTNGLPRTFSPPKAVPTFAGLYLRHTTNRAKQTCLSCKDDGLECDGLTPCARCLDWPLSCTYHDTDITHSMHEVDTQRTSVRGRFRENNKSNSELLTPSTDSVLRAESENSKARISISGDGAEVQMSPSDISLSRRDIVDKSQSPSFATRSMMTPSKSSDQPTASSPPIASSFNDVLALVSKYQKELDGYREYLLEVLLNQAKHDTKTTCSVRHSPKRINPFKQMVEQTKNLTHRTDEGAQRVLTLSIKTSRGNGPKKFVPTRLPIQDLGFDSKAPILPKYKSIGRLGTTFLSKNQHTLKYKPYFVADEHDNATSDEKDKELNDLFKFDETQFLEQKRCQEKVGRWQLFVAMILQDLNISASDVASVISTESTKCPGCKTRPRPKANLSAGPAQALTLPKKLAPIQCKVEWLSQAMEDVLSIALWHFVEMQNTTQTQVSLVANVRDQDNNPDSQDSVSLLGELPLSPKSSKMCSICFLHNCMTHGSYDVANADQNEIHGQDDDDEDDSTASEDGKKSRKKRKPKVFIDDPEHENNLRREVKLSLRPRSQQHQCGVYCLQDIGSDFPPTQLYGRLRNGTISGLKNEKAVSNARNVFADDVFCSEECFWDVSARGGLDEVVELRSLTVAQRSIFDMLARLYSGNVRLPCIIAKNIPPISCATSFDLLLELHNSTLHSLPPETSPPVENGADLFTTTTIFKRANKIAEGYITSNSSKHETRPPFVPCSHDGPCLPEYGCSCAIDEVHCEWFCNCAEDCKRRYKGCRCKGSVCFNDDRCECWRLNRECDPWLCGVCGVMEVLDPSNKYREEIRVGRCRNNRIQLGLPARTIKAPSEVQGWGLFAGEDLDVNAYIGEYKGEVISVMEGDRRGVVYHNIGQEYLFTMNKEQQIDGSNFGNKTRFMNNSQLEKNINVQAKVLLCNGVYRVMMYTKKRVRAGEELLYNYNYPAYVTKDFWERGEQPTNQPGVVAPLARSRLTGRFVKTVANDDDVADSPPELEEPVKQGRKRKRRLVDDDDDDYGTPVHDSGLLKHANAPHNISLSNERSSKRAKAGATVTFAEGHRSDSQSINEEDSNYADDDAFEDDIGASEEIEPDTAVSPQVEDSDDDNDNNNGYTRAGKPRQKRIFENDRRKGGAAQRRAWETRKARMAQEAALALSKANQKGKAVPKSR